MNVKKVFKCVAYHSMIVLRGLAKVLYGTVTAGLVVLAVYGFAAIPSEGGYAAVNDFLSAAICIVMALALMYFFGCKGCSR